MIQDHGFLFDHNSDFSVDIGPASVMVGNIVQGNRLASAQGRDIGLVDDDSDSSRKYQFISEILKWRSQTTADHVIYTLLNSKVTHSMCILYLILSSN